MPLHPDPTYVADWNVTYQRQFAGSWLASVSYLGNKTTHLWIAERNGSSGVFGHRRLYHCRRELLDLLHHFQHQPAPVFYPGESGHWQLLREHRHHGRWRRRALRRHCCYRIAHRFSQQLPDQCPTSPIRTACPTTISALPWPAPTNSQLFNRHADWGPCVSDTRYNFNFSAVAVSAFQHEQLLCEPHAEQLAARSAYARFERPASDSSRRAKTIRAPASKTTGLIRCWRIPPPSTPSARRRLFASNG